MAERSKRDGSATVLKITFQLNTYGKTFEGTATVLGTLMVLRARSCSIASFAHDFKPSVTTWPAHDEDVSPTQINTKIKLLLNNFSFIFKTLIVEG